MKSILFSMVLFISVSGTAAKLDEQLRSIPPEQRAKALEVLERYRADIEALRAEVRIKSQTLLPKVRNPGKGDGYRKGLLEEFELLQIARTKLTSKQFEMRLEIREFLTRDQIAKFDWVPVPNVVKRGEIDY